jgi:hypothetical protein
VSGLPSSAPGVWQSLQPPYVTRYLPRSTAASSASAVPQSTQPEHKLTISIHAKDLMFFLPKPPPQAHDIAPTRRPHATLLPQSSGPRRLMKVGRVGLPESPSLLPPNGGEIGRRIRFPRPKRSKPLSVMALEMVLRRMQVAGATVHGFGSVFRDWAAEECGPASAGRIKVATEAVPLRTVRPTRSTAGRASDRLGY